MEQGLDFVRVPVALPAPESPQFQVHLRVVVPATWEDEKSHLVRIFVFCLILSSPSDIVHVTLDMSSICKFNFVR